MVAELVVFGLLVVCLWAVMSGGSPDGGGDGSSGGGDGSHTHRQADTTIDTQRERGSFRTDTSNLERFAPKGGDDRR